jgi:hypothetical protein
MKQPENTQPENYQPQVRDTTNGPNIHTYIPRSDGTVLIGGVVFVPQTTAEASSASTITAQHYIVPPGGPAVPAFNVLTAPQYCSPSQYRLAFPSFLALLHVCFDGHVKSCLIPS